jgi:hypothetical protein
VRLAGLTCRPEDFPGAEEVHRRGFFIGLHTKPLPEKQVRLLASLMLGYDFSS